MRMTDTVDVLMSTVAKRWKETVPAKIYGPLAVHKDLVQGSRDGREFTSRRVIENGVKGLRIWRTA